MPAQEGILLTRMRNICSKLQRNLAAKLQTKKEPGVQLGMDWSVAHQKSPHGRYKSQSTQPRKLRGQPVATPEAYVDSSWNE